MSKKIIITILSIAFIIGIIPMKAVQTARADACLQIFIDWNWWNYYNPYYDCYDYCYYWDCCECYCHSWFYWWFPGCPRPVRMCYHHREYLGGRWRYYHDDGRYYYAPQEGRLSTRRGYEKYSPEYREKPVTRIREAEPRHITNSERQVERPPTKNNTISTKNNSAPVQRDRECSETRSHDDEVRPKSSSTLNSRSSSSKPSGSIRRSK
ncbi:hypothetical protein JW877_08140 [bacterium]|nr:hypothetical protein [bacterium]